MKRRRKSGQKQRKYASRFAALVIVASLGLLLFWPYIRTGFLKAFIPVGRGTPGFLEEKTAGDALFTGGDTLLRAPIGGAIKFLVKDGDTVRVGDVIAEIGDKDAISAVQESLALARDNLEKFEEGTQGEFSRLVRETQAAYESAVRSFFELQRVFACGDVRSLPEKERAFLTETNVLSDKRSRLMAIENERARLKGEVELLEKIASQSAVRVLAPVAGTFSSTVTDVEDKVRANDISQKDASELMMLAQKVRGSRTFSIQDGQKVKQGDPIGRIISGEKVSFFLPVKTEERPDVGLGKRILIEYEDGFTLNGVVTGIRDGKPPGYSVLSGEIQYVPVDRYTYAARISLISKRFNGILVPVESILEKDGQTGVLVVQKTYARFVPVEVLMVKGDRAVIKGISETDEIVLKAAKFLEGRRVR
ncbi:MAG TPA: hypothetical protein GXX30_02225 [Firmicutes bacterium]|nr:hypothetical protein [Candidatus Fermentithermobacillaceae bacterium]